MSETVIKVEHLSKKYQLGTIGTGTLYKDLNLWWYKVRGKKNPYARIDESSDFNDISEHWALKDVSFEIKQGDAVGIIGKNGAGKSTLLKILSRITTPTSGNIKIKGRVASLLEVGTGFSGELTGRENIYLNGAILGMSKAYISSRLDEIIDFSGVEKYIDTPVKRYSSGMYVRLAFAVAAHLEPEILIVDEVLAVGDAEFQKKCLGKMNDVNSKDGRTILFVSHDMQAISTLTKNCILLNSGGVKAIGSTKKVIESYLNLNVENALQYVGKKSDTVPRIIYMGLETNLPNNTQQNGNDLTFIIKVHTPIKIKNAWLAIHVHDVKKRNFIHVWTNANENSFLESEGVYEIKCLIPKCKLYMGRYLCTLYLAEPPGGRLFEALEDVCPFEIVMYDQYREYSWAPDACAYLEDSQWSTKKV